MSTDEVNPWGASLDKFKEWDPDGLRLVLQVGASPWKSGVFTLKEVELISLALNCACTNLDEAGMRRHIRAALEAGAMRDEVLMVLKMGFGLAVLSLNFPRSGRMNSSRSARASTRAPSSARSLSGFSVLLLTPPSRTCTRQARGDTSRQPSSSAPPCRRS